MTPIFWKQQFVVDVDGRRRCSRERSSITAVGDGRSSSTVAAGEAAAVGGRLRPVVGGGRERETGGRG
jgi:hypothetical protein